VITDSAPQALSRCVQLILELSDPTPGGFDLKCPGVTFGNELAVRCLELGNAGDQRGLLRAFDLGTELETQALGEGRLCLTETANLLSSDSEVGPQALGGHSG